MFVSHCSQVWAWVARLALLSVVVLPNPGCTVEQRAGLGTDATQAVDGARASLLPVPESGLRFDSKYSIIVVREEGTARTLYFVDDQGRERIESRMDVAEPERLLVDYTRAMFASYLFVPEPQRVLLIGVGAGSMVRFWQHYEPGLAVDAVDIDPVVLRIAHDYFGTKESAGVRLIEADGFAFLKDTQQRYDVIYLDAFLKPSGETDKTGVPRRLKTIQTYQEMQGRLTPGGIVVINLHYPTLEEDLAQLREAFARVFLFRVPGTGNYVLVGSMDSTALSAEQLSAAGRRADKRLGADFSIEALVPNLDVR